MKKYKDVRFAQWMITLGVCVGMLAGLLYSLKTLKELDIFTIKEVLNKEDNKNINASYLIGKKIFDIDLRGEAERISREYPLYKKVRLIRVLPNRIFMDGLRRRPLALVKLYRSFAVDEEMMLFDAGDASPGGQDAGLPSILGLETKIFGPKAGRQYFIRELAGAVTIIKEFQKNSSLRTYRIDDINVANASNTSFELFDLSKKDAAKESPKAAQQRGVEVRIGRDSIKDKMNILGDVLVQIKNDFERIKYIDVRFKEPVVSYQDAKNDVKKQSQGGGITRHE